MAFCTVQSMFSLTLNMLYLKVMLHPSAVFTGPTPGLITTGDLCTSRVPDSLLCCFLKFKLTRMFVLELEQHTEVMFSYSRHILQH